MHSTELTLILFNFSSIQKAGKSAILGSLTTFIKSQSKNFHAFKCQSNATLPYFVAIRNVKTKAILKSPVLL